MMLSILYLIIVFYLLFFRKSQKFSWLIAALLIAFLSITTINYADLNNYGPVFDYCNSSAFQFSLNPTELVWAILCKIFYGLGFNYRGMIIILVIINYFLLHVACKNIKCNENKFFGLFLIFPAIIQLVQLKFFTAISIVVLAYTILLKNRNRKNILVFILLVLLAFLIHSSVIVFMILLFARNKKINGKILLPISVTMTLLVSLNLNIIVKYSKYFISTRQYERYVENTLTPSSLQWIFAIVIIWLICYISSVIVRKYVKKDRLIEENSNYEINNNAIILMALTLPLLILDRNMHRFLEMGYIILIFTIGMIFYNKIATKNKVLIVVCATILLTITMYVYTPYETVIKPLFSYDEIIDIRR